MSLQALLAYVFSAGLSNSSQSDPEKGPSPDAAAPDADLELERNDGGDLEDVEANNSNDGSGDEDDNVDNDDEADEDPSPRRNTTTKPDATSESDSEPSHTSWLTKIKTFVFPSNDDDIESFIPNYRYTPIISGIVIPFSILLEIPGLTEHWYVRTEGPNHDVVETQSNSTILDIGLAFSIACAVAANICLIMRFLEKRVKTATIFCTVFLTIHDLINITGVTVFGIEHRFDDGFTYGESFWMTVCSTMASSVTNVTLIVDLIRTPEFDKSGSGLTRKQRSLVIIIIILFCYIALGSLANSLIMKLSFIDGLFFSVVSIETIGFGDIVPTSTGARIFVCIYSALGIVNLAVVVGMFRETVMEGLEVGYRKRMKVASQKRRMARRKRRAEQRWRDAIMWRLRERRVPVWVPESKKAELEGRLTNAWRKLKSRLTIAFHAIPMPTRTVYLNHGPHGMRLNLEALSHSQLEAAALEAGVPLDTLLPPQYYYNKNEREEDRPEHTLPPWFVTNPIYHHEQMIPDSLTHGRMGTMAAMLTKFALVVFESTGPLPEGQEIANESFIDASAADASTTLASSRASSSDDLGADYHALVVESEKKAFYVRAIMAWSLFIVFWTVGSAIFMQTEGWTYGVSLYFCFIAFTTIGYGDYAPRTPAGRSVFVVWALVGVGTMTILISIISEAYSTRYKGIIHSGSFDKAVGRYRKRTKDEFTEKTQQISAVRFHPQEPPSASKSRKQVEANHASTGPLTSLRRLRELDVSTDDLTQAHAHAQQTLEALPQHVLNEARSFQQYIRYLGDGVGGSSSDEAEEHVDSRLKSLLDDVTGIEGMKESAKIDILRDQDSRRTLFTLSIEKSLKELMNIAEEAVAAVKERDRVIAALRQERYSDDVAEGSD
ncbi:voltage-gated potassium channel [Leucogyrophana mollusca]|uniref:Voltage-gated potassium channel n=1 Tax=Leucogyrophana mollusca TaxID=85980 RepID=A0ACB8BC83_9AGAM|nr:voltage-gated potassium channel [Leucogyrophana mollusca]